MGCNCGKSTPPAGSQPPAEQPAAEARVASAAAKAPAGSSTPAERPAQQAFTLSSSHGTQTFGSRLEADAERARHGGTVRQVR